MCADTMPGDTAGHKFSLALVAKAPIAHAVGATAGGGGGFEWQDKTQGGLHRNACDSEGRYVFTPLYALKRPIKRDRKTHRDNGLPEPAGDNLSVLLGLSFYPIARMLTWTFLCLPDGMMRRHLGTRLTKRAQKIRLNR